MPFAIRTVLVLALGALLFGCATAPIPSAPAPQPAEIPAVSAAPPPAPPAPVQVETPAPPPPSAPVSPEVSNIGGEFAPPKGETSGYTPRVRRGPPLPAKVLAPTRRPSPGGLIGRPQPAALPPGVLPTFPWPPPTPSERLNFRRSQVLTAAMGPTPSQADVAHRIVHALEEAGYSEYSFYAAPQGFAIVARLERIGPDGTPAPDQLRFLAPDSAEPFSLGAYLTRLFFAPEGYYRQIVFLVTPTIVRPSGPTPNAKAAEALLQGGADRLPALYRTIPFSADDQVTALIYEYHKGSGDGQVTTLTPGRLDARTNLVRAGIYAQLVAAKR